MRIVAASMFAMGAMLSLAATAQAATQVGKTNEFLIGDGKFSFSLSLTPTAGAVGTRDIPALLPVAATSKSFAQTLSTGNGEAVKVAFSVAARDGVTSITGGVFTGNVGSVRAPMAGPDKAYAGTYLGIDDQSSDGVGKVGLSFTQTVNGSSVDAAPKSVQILLGSLTTERFEMGRELVYASEISGAAKALGIAGGNQGSYYVTFNALGSNTFGSGLGVLSSDNYFHVNALELVPVSYSLASNDFSARDSYVDGKFVPQGASPAPLPALAGTFPGLLLAMGAMKAMRRNRRPA